LAKPPQQTGYVPLVTTPGKRVTVEAFLISKVLLRLEQWLALISQPSLSHLADLVSIDHLIEIESCKTTETSVTIGPPASEVQWAGAKAEARQIPQQPVPNPVLTLEARLAAQVAAALGATLPAWYEWEIAVRGPQGRLYLRGNEIDLYLLSLEYQDYSIDEESVMGYYNYDQEVYFIHSFGPYLDAPSPFGLTGLAWPGREWNRCDQNEPWAETPYILRSMADLGAMASMIPGIRPGTWGAEGWHQTKRHLAFSGPVLPCYAAETVGMRRDEQGNLVGEALYSEAGFRLVFSER
jgi:hypothetical protein